MDNSLIAECVACVGGCQLLEGEKIVEGNQFFFMYDCSSLLFSPSSSFPYAISLASFIKTVKQTDDKSNNQKQNVYL